VFFADEAATASVSGQAVIRFPQADPTASLVSLVYEGGAVASATAQTSISITLDRLPDGPYVGSVDGSGQG
jgi:hypothetical protein